MKIKICGMKYIDNIQKIASLQPDYLGFIFYKHSPRYIRTQLSKTQVNALPDSLQKVGVFVNESPGKVLKTATDYGLDFIQLHGDESPETCAFYKEKGLNLIKAIRLNKGNDFSILAPYVPYVDYFLFDSQGDKYGGNGASFDWKILNNYTLKTPFFLSGGLNLDNLSSALKLPHPQLFGLDANSGLEETPGLKNVLSTQQFITKTHAHE